MTARIGTARGVRSPRLRRWRLLLASPLIAAAVGCGGGGDGGGGSGETTNPPPPAGTPLPAAAVGPWSTTLTYVPAYYQGAIPVQDFLGSLGVSMTLQADGQYRFDLRSASSYFNGNCFRTTHWSETGRVSIANAAITFTPAHASNMVLDSCGAAQYVDPAPVGPATYGIAWEQDATGWPRLRLHLPTGDDLVLEKCRTCG